MKSFLIVVLLAFAATLFSIGDAEARKRLGGGKSTGMQRDSVPAPKAPAQNAAVPASPAAPVATPAPASGMSKWLGPLAGLAAGGLLASMFMGGGFSGIKMMDILLFAGLAFGAFMLFRLFMQKKAMGGASAASSPMQYAGGTVTAPEIGSKLMTPGGDGAVPASALRIPADFDVPGFERQARFAFIRLQAANDARDVNDIRDFTTPEMYAELSLQIQERGDAPQKTEIVSLNVNVLEVVTEGQRTIASVHYNGELREEAGAPAEPFDEIWHVAKRLDDAKSTWLLAGIQQTS